MKFLHVADLHLDREFEGLVQQTAYKPYQIMANIVDYAIEQAVDFVIFAGDNFHQPQPSIRMQTYFTGELERLQTAGIQSVVIFGNHDYYRDNIYWSPFPKDAIVFYNEDVTTKWLTTRSGEKVAVSAFSYQHPHISQNKAIEYPMREFRSDYHIGIYHGEVGGGNYAPATLSDMKAKNYDYWALGHIHLFQKLAENVYYPGTPQGRTKKETTNYVNLVELTHDHIRVDQIDLAEIHWVDLTIDLSDNDDLPDVLKTISGYLDDPKVFYSMTLTHFEQVAQQLNEAVENGELLEELRSRGYVVVKIKLKGEVEGGHPKIAVAKLDLTQFDLDVLAGKLPHIELVQSLLTDEFKAEVLEDVAQFAQTHFNIGEGDQG